MLRSHRSLARAFALPALAVVLAAFAPGAAAADQYDIDPVHSVVLFRIKHMNAGVFYGRFNGPTGSFTLDEADPSKSTLQAQVKTASFDSGNAQRDQHVRGPDFLSAKEFPTATFKSKSVKAADDGKYEVAGDLTLHGQTKPVTIVLEKIGSNGKIVGFEGTMDIRRSDFGMKSMQGVSDEVRMILAFEGKKK